MLLSKLLGLVLLFTASGAVHANLIDNGSFEVDPFTANGNYTLGLSGYDVTGWYIPDSDGVYPWGLQDGAFGATTPYGDQFLVLGLWNTGFEYSIQQTLTGLTVGAMYDLSFAIASELDCCSQAEVSFLNGSSTAAQIFNATDSGSYWTDWTTQGLSFIADSSDVTLQFKNVNVSAAGHDLGLDNVIVEQQQVSVPEPATVALMGIALFMLGWLRKRAKTADITIR